MTVVSHQLWLFPNTWARTTQRGTIFWQEKQLSLLWMEVREKLPDRLLGVGRGWRGKQGATVLQLVLWIWGDTRIQNTVQGSQAFIWIVIINITKLLWRKIQACLSVAWTKLPNYCSSVFLALQYKFYEEFECLSRAINLFNTNALMVLTIKDILFLIWNRISCHISTIVKDCPLHSVLEVVTCTITNI